MLLDFTLTVFVLLFVPSYCQAQILPPCNVSAVWNSTFEPGLSWLPPHHSTPNCSYNVSYRTSSKFSRENLIVDKSPWYNFDVMEGGFIQWSISTVCQKNTSVAVVLNVSYPDIVTHLECYLFAPEQSRCEWLPNSNPPDLKFFYELVNLCTKSIPDPLVECSSYIYNESMKTGCEIHATKCHKMYVLLNGTLNNKPVMNTFVRMFKDNVRLPPLTFTAIRNGNKINMSWIEPDIFPKDWEFKISYTECDVVKESISIKGETAYLLDSESHCQYNIAIRAESQRGKSPWSDWKHFDAQHDSNWNLYTFVLVPTIFAILTAFACVGFQKNRKIFFPEVPKPTDLLKDMMEKKFAGSYVNVLVKEEEDCIITLVRDPKQGAEC